MPLEVYRLVSTGRVMLQTFFLGGWYAAWLFGGTCYYPAVKGSFQGKVFYGGAFDPAYIWHTFIAGELLVPSGQEANVKVSDVQNRREALKGTVPAQGELAVYPKAAHIIVEADQPVIVMVRNTGLAQGGLKAGQTAYLDIPSGGNFSGEAYLFACKETTVTLDDVNLKLAADEYLPLRGGLHKLSASENVVFQVANWPAASDIQWTYAGRIPSFMRLSDYGACIPSVQTLDLTYEDLELKPLIGQELPLTYIAAGAAVALAVIVTAFAFRRRSRA